DEGVERDKAVAARTILHHYRLAPARGQTLGEQTGCGIAGAGSAKRQDEVHRSRRKRLLRARRERPRGPYAAEQRDKRAAVHSIASSARSRSASGTFKPSTLAVVRLMTKSNLVGCSTGISGPALLARSLVA